MISETETIPEAGTVSETETIPEAGTVSETETIPGPGMTSETETISGPGTVSETETILGTEMVSETGAIFGRMENERHRLGSQLMSFFLPEKRHQGDFEEEPVGEIADQEEARDISWKNFIC